MTKERFLTVMIPITDSDVTATYQSLSALLENVTPSKDVINNIYRVESPMFGFFRAWLNPDTNQYQFHQVVDREFPYLGKPLEIFDFTYDATRMGSAPTISAQGIMRYADYDEEGNEVTLENLWNQKCHVIFNGENFYLKQIPTSSKSNEDARYKYDIDFVSERVVLENVYLYDVVQPFITEQPVSESSQFSFYGDINELMKRINASLIRSGLATIAFRDNQSEYVLHPRLLTDGTRAADSQFFTYEEWNAINLGTYDGDLSTTDPYIAETPEGDYSHWHNNIYDHYNGDYNEYLRKEVYQVNENGEYELQGYQCKIGIDKKGQVTTSEEKLIHFEDNTIHEALQQFYDIFELQYYIYREKDANGDFTGNTIIMVGDCEHDFADLNTTGDDFVRDGNNIPTTTNPFAYGAKNALLSIEKTNTTEKIVTRITGVGSSENIPWYYPNPNADGWIKPIYKRNGAVQNISIGFPTSEGNDTASSVLYEKYLKNRIGKIFQFGKRIMSLGKLEYIDEYGTFKTSVDESRVVLAYTFTLTSSTRIYSEGFRCNVEGSSVVMNIYKDGVAMLSNDYFFIQNGGGGSLSAGVYHIIFTISFSNGAPSVVDNVQYYYYPALYGFCDPWKTWGVRTTINMLTGILSLSYIRTLIGSFTGFNMTIPPFLSTNPNLKPKVSENAKDFGWYNGSSRIDTSAMKFIGDGEEYYAFAGGDGIKNVGYDDIFKITQIGTADTANLQYLGYNPYNWGSTTQFWVAWSYGDASKKYNTVSANEVDFTIDTFVTQYITFSFNGYLADGWYQDNKKVNLDDFGLSNVPTNSNCEVTDTIEFQRVKYVTPQPNLMPEVYIQTDGERRFYPAVNYPLVNGIPDKKIGEFSYNGGISNNIYKEKDENTAQHYTFENENMQTQPHEHIENFDDVKPTITKKAIQIGERTLRIDVVEEFAYDLTDNDEVWESEDDGGTQGEYKHPHFFAKLRPLGFNIFDLALQEDMVLSMTTGSVGACNFKIKVDENTKKNPVQIWEYDVYKKDGNSYTLVYAKDTLRRVVDTSHLYYKLDDEVYMLVDTDTLPVAAGSETATAYYSDLSTMDVATARNVRIERHTYSTTQVQNGEVGSLRDAKRQYFVGDVVTSGKFISSQQDTSSNYVWVALEKDTDTYGVIMPSAKPNYEDDNFSLYIRPKAIQDVKVEGSTDAQDEELADKFVLINIRLPQVYLRTAERLLSRKLVAYMYDNNYQKFNFSIKFSRIFLAQTPSVEEYLNENSVLYIRYIKEQPYRQYVKHYTYKMSHDVPLPEITIELNEELNVTRTHIEQETTIAQRVAHNTNHMIRNWSRRLTDYNERRFIRSDQDVVFSGNFIAASTGSSLSDISEQQSQFNNNLFSTQVNLENNHFKRKDFLFGDDFITIGEELHLAVPYKDGRVFRRRKWDSAAEAYVVDADKDFTPAFFEDDNVLIDDSGKTLRPVRFSSTNNKEGAFTDGNTTFSAPVVSRMSVVEQTVVKRITDIKQKITKKELQELLENPDNDASITINKSSYANDANDDNFGTAIYNDGTNIFYFWVEGDGSETPIETPYDTDKP